MHSRGFDWYMMAVLAYHRCEWTDVDADDKEYRLLLTKELGRVIQRCYRSNTNVPNAAKEVGIFLSLMDGSFSAKEYEEHDEHS